MDASSIPGAAGASVAGANATVSGAIGFPDADKDSAGRFLTPAQINVWKRLSAAFVEVGDDIRHDEEAIVAWVKANL
jgi:hypothetical protein